MYGSIRKALAVTTAALAFAAPAAAAETEYVPFVTDFPKPAGPANPVGAPAVADDGAGFNWESAGVGVAVGLGAGIALLGLTRRRTAVA